MSKILVSALYSRFDYFAILNVIKNSPNIMIITVSILIQKLDFDVCDLFDNVDEGKKDSAISLFD